MTNLFNPVIASGGAGSMKPFLMMLVVLVPFFLVQYFTMVRPQQKKQKEYEQLLNEVMKGDKIITSSGFYGTITRVIDDEAIIVELEPAKIRLKLNRNCIYNVIEHGEARKNTKIVLDENNNFVKVGAPTEEEEYNPEDDVFEGAAQDDEE
ncbi:MAG: preprotein translocase subunit YajC [Eubacteriaceae bacterium]|nr:preprotein translocase subunit YajC [Eubacteriaceae bacterium]